MNGELEILVSNPLVDVDYCVKYYMLPNLQPGARMATYLCMLAPIAERNQGRPKPLNLLLELIEFYQHAKAVIDQPTSAELEHVSVTWSSISPTQFTFTHFTICHGATLEAGIASLTQLGLIFTTNLPPAQQDSLGNTTAGTSPHHLRPPILSSQQPPTHPPPAMASPTMASPTTAGPAAAADDVASLMSIPLELRHNIFEFTALRSKPAKKLLRAWFERKDIAERVAQLAASNPNGPAPRVVAAHDSDPDSDAGDDEDQDDQEDDDEQDEEDDNIVEDEDNEAADGDDNGDGLAGDGNTAITTQAVPGPIIQPHRKWRHIPNFMRISHCPPTLELLLTCKELSREAMDWYYDVAILRIDATGSFAHTSFFEESLGEITDAPLSPVENIRRVDVTFVWDSAWLRASEAFEGIYQAMLRQRAEFVIGILKRAPELKTVTVHWHDSANDEESTALKLDVLEGFYAFLGSAELNLEEHYLSPGEEPDATSLAGKQRVEFQRILDENHNFQCCLAFLISYWVFSFILWLQHFMMGLGVIVRSGIDGLDNEPSLSWRQGVYMYARGWRTEYQTFH
ncbi:uncharacterized protein BDR25DRAFT_391274 [Lindgomyces ingoldianus]|uniref:Uncharacterized protein n=1 Tax=Lindgomyces ingoldianus TaxID=673940 RepID=A0ACB6R9X9_9PLEO|nr:uncharacterized protein BDR25DRAFT_391274 [Lindgomyces ingoldianus]KAF2475860.1 hypothetical protein BDR25DRAFT_391274 [Lindgomyces ingoldianus]